MPYKRKYKKKKRRRRRSTTLVRQPKAVADSQIVKLNYATFVGLDAGAATTKTHLFSCNNMHDPDITATGHQPLGYDEWSLFYNHYTVLGAKITVKFVPSSFDAITGAAIVGLSVEDDLTLTSSIPTQLMERTGTRYGIMGTSEATSAKTLTHTFSAKKFFGVKDMSDNTGRLGALIGSSPVEQAYFHVSAGAVDNSSNPATVIAVVKIQYIVKFSERKTLLAS